MAWLARSLEARLMIRPAATYAALPAATPGGVGHLLRRPATLALVLACFVSFTTTGRLSIRMLVDGIACWGFVPLMNLALVGALAGCFSKRGLVAGVDAYLAASGPWLAWLVGVAGFAVWWPPAEGKVWSLVPSPVAFAGLLAAWLWSSCIQFRCLTLVWRLPRTPALVLLCGMKAAVWGAIALFFLLSDQLEPRLGWWPGG